MTYVNNISKEVSEIRLERIVAFSSVVCNIIAFPQAFEIFQLSEFYLHHFINYLTRFQPQDEVSPEKQLLLSCLAKIFQVLSLDHPFDKDLSGLSSAKQELSSAMDVFLEQCVDSSAAVDTPLPDSFVSSSIGVTSGDATSLMVIHHLLSLHRDLVAKSLDEQGCLAKEKKVIMFNILSSLGPPPSLAIMSTFQQSGNLDMPNVRLHQKFSKVCSIKITSPR